MTKIPRRLIERIKKQIEHEKSMREPDPLAVAEPSENVDEAPDANEDAEEEAEEEGPEMERSATTESVAEPPTDGRRDSWEMLPATEPPADGRRDSWEMLP